MIRQNGISIIEVILITACISFLVFLIGSLPNSVRLIGRSQNISLAREIASKQIEEKRNLQYANLPYGDQSITDSRLSMLPGGTGIVSIADCSPSVCTLGNEIAKEVVVTVTWIENAQNQSVSLKTIIAQGGLN